MSGMWANRYPTLSYAKRHNHSRDDDVIDIIFNIKKPERSGDLFLKIDNNEYRLGIDEGDLIIFPGVLEHWTDPNQSGEDRIIIGLEYHLRGGYNDSRYS